jgi:hypothetical protein
MSASEQPIVHTPEPWLVSVTFPGVVFAGEPSERIKISQVAIKHDHPSATETRRLALVIEENSKLIAAAPALLSAALDVLELHEHEQDRPAVRQLRKAIEKATGKVV